MKLTFIMVVPQVDLRRWGKTPPSVSAEINWNATVLVLQKKSKFRRHLNTGELPLGNWGKLSRNHFCIKFLTRFETEVSACRQTKDDKYLFTTAGTRNCYAVYTISITMPGLSLYPGTRKS
eukprot:3371665-Rhodomonas_salina.1